MGTGQLNIEEEQEKDKKIVALKLITGGKDSGGGTGNYLLDMEVGTVFFVQENRGTDFVLGMFHLVAKDGKVIALEGPATQGQRLYVDPYRFALKYNLYYTVGMIGPNQEEQESKDHEQSDRAEGDGNGAA